MKILVLGSAGMLGHVVTLYLREKGYEVVDVSKHRKINKDTILLDLLAHDDLSKLLVQNFDIVINCAALLVKACEENKTKAILLNSCFPHVLGNMLNNTKSRVIQMSTDGVFSGMNAPYHENDRHDSGLFYGKTKSLGEINNDKDLTIRASVVGGDMWESGIGLFNWFVKQNGLVYGYHSTIFNAVTTLEFAKFIEYVIRHPISGVCHLGAKKSISKADFLVMVKQTFCLDDVWIEKIKNDETNHTLINTRRDIVYDFNGYDEMLLELREWIELHPEIYRHYEFFRR